MGGHGAHNHSAHSAAPDAHTAMMGLRCDGSFLPKGGGTWMGKQRAFKRCGARLVPVPGLWWCWATCKLIWPGERTRTCAGARSGKGCREPPVSSPLSCCKARSSLGRWAARRHPARAPPAAAAGGTGSFGPALFFTSALVPDPAACPPPSVQATSTQVIRRHRRARGGGLRRAWPAQVAARRRGACAVGGQKNRTVAILALRSATLWQPWITCSCSRREKLQALSQRSCFRGRIITRSCSSPSAAPPHPPAPIRRPDLLPLGQLVGLQHRGLLPLGVTAPALQGAHLVPAGGPLAKAGGADSEAGGAGGGHLL